MHILYICNTYPDRHNSRKGIFYRDQVEASKSTGNQVGVIVVNGISYLELIQRKKFSQIFSNDNGLPIYRSVRLPIPILIHTSWFYYFSIVAPVLFLFHQYKKRYGCPDVIHAQNFFFAGFVSLKIKDLIKCPVILTEHDSSYLTGKLSLRKVIILKRYLNKFDKVIAVSHSLANKIKELSHIKRLSVIGNLVDTDFFQNKKYPKKSVFTYAILANLDKNKSVDIAVKAFHKSFYMKKNVQLLIVGDGPEKLNIENLIYQLDLKNQVNIIGFLNREELLDFYRKVHVVLSTSKNETFGLTLAEAMSCGLPVISTRSGGPEDFITEDNGFLTVVDDIDSISEKMVVIYENYNKYFPEKIRTNILNNYSKYVITKKLNEIYHRLIDC